MLAKFKSMRVGVGKNPVFVVGQCPGRQRKKNETFNVWEGNRSGDLMQEIIKGLDNIFLTNIVNVWSDGEIAPGQIQDGLNELTRDVKDMEPVGIMCIGAFAKRHVETSIKHKNIAFAKHPSYIIRFGKNREKYMSEVRAMIQGLQG